MFKNELRHFVFSLIFQRLLCCLPSWASVSVLLRKTFTQTSVAEMPHVSPGKQRISV
jgi:hypothetical protein